MVVLGCSTKSGYSMRMGGRCGPRLSDHVMMVNNAKALTKIFTRSCYSGNQRPNLAVPVFLTQLLNRKSDITVGISPYLMAIVTRIVSR